MRAGVEAEPRDRAFADEVADHDHAVGSAHASGARRDAAKRSLRAREQRRQVEVLHVVQRHDGRLRHRRERESSGDSGRRPPAASRAAERAGAQRPRGSSRPGAAGSCARPVLGRNLGREALSGVGRDRRQRARGRCASRSAPARAAARGRRSRCRRARPGPASAARSRPPGDRLRAYRAVIPALYTPAQ